MAAASHGHGSRGCHGMGHRGRVIIVGGHIRLRPLTVAIVPADLVALDPPIALAVALLAVALFAIFICS
eukprot:jgi/Chrpa1/3208/Chrysochromulina_OHIO_Genome00002388-RA